MKLNGKEFELDLYDVETFEKVEKHYAEFMEVLFVKFETQSQAVRAHCNALIKLLDEVIGDGAGIEVLGNRINYRTVITVHDQFITDIIKQRNELDKLGSEQLKKFTGDNVVRKSKK